MSIDQTTGRGTDLAGLHSEYSILREGAGLLSLKDDGILRIQGSERESWLHNLVTSNIKALEPRGAYGLLLNGSAHVLADFVVLAEPESFLLYSSPRAKDKLFSQLRRSIFREHVALQQLDDLSLLSLQGPLSEQVLVSAFGPVSQLESFHFIRKGQLLIVRNARAARHGYDLIVPQAQLAQVRGAVLQHSAREISLDALNVARIEAGIAWYGDDFDETMLAPEARLDAFIAENKGCYPGQEVIARIHNLGHVNRLLVQLLLKGETVPLRGDLIFSADREVGWITSPTWSFQYDAPLALGYLRREMATKGTQVEIARDGDRLPARVLGP